MTEEQQKDWFNKLHQKRHNTAVTLMEDFAVSNIWNSVVEKYSDQAHFIYELLQNANDAKATKSFFDLREDGLYFTHNGKRHFWVSNPDNEKSDQQNSKLGDINAITAVAQSNKREHTTIGKFGVGFKSVFQYTETPHIYDPNFQFKIEKFIVPVKLENDLQNRQNDETVFYFPFNKPDMPKERAYSDILEKLKTLVFPTLFLPILQEVTWCAGNEKGSYTKQSLKKEQKEDITYEQIKLYQQIGLNQTTELYLFSRPINENQNLIYSIGYFLDEKGKLIPKQFPAFCYFPTKETTGLNFILHAPFLLTDSRESIHRSKEHNTKMIDLLSQLAADSLLILKDLKLIDDNITEIIPYKMPVGDGFFAPFHHKIKQKFDKEKILPAKDEYVGKENAYWAEDNSVIDHFSDEQLADLIKNKNAKWVFRSLVRNKTEKDRDLRYYIEGCTRGWYDVSKLLTQLDGSFIEKQTIEWLCKFYKFLSESRSYWESVKTKPIFLNQDRKAVAAFERKGNQLHEILFLPEAEYALPASNFILPDFLNDEEIKNILTKTFGIRKPSLKDAIYNTILPLYDRGENINAETSKTHFKIFFDYWKDGGKPEEFISLIKDKKILLYRTKEGKAGRGKSSEIYYPTPELKKYFESKPDAKFVDLDCYKSTIKEKEKDLEDFLLKLGVNKLPRIFELEKTTIQLTEMQREYISQRIHVERIYKVTDKDIDGVREIVEAVNRENSLILWCFLKQLPSDKYSSGIYNYFYYTDRRGEFESTALELLKTRKWLLSNNGEFVAPNEITVEELDKCYSRGADSVQLESLLGFKPVVRLTKEQKIAQHFESEEEALEAKKALEEKREKEKKRAERKEAKSNIKIEASDLEDAVESLKNLSEFISKPKSEEEKKNVSPDFDEDEELAKGVEELKKHLDVKKERIRLVETINKSVKYSYDWFKAYLELLTTYREKQSAQNQKSISFQEIKPYTKDNKHFLLRGASGYVSSEIEDAEDIRVSLIFRNAKKEHITVEGVSKRGQDLLIYCRESMPNDLLTQLSQVFRVEINFTPVVDLLQRLHDAFSNEKYIDRWEKIQETLPPLNFIYGPPGTGKTTTLCNKIEEILSSNPQAKFLVLTPTNKAADVVCKKLLEMNAGISALRLSRPTDPDLEDTPIYRDTLSKDDIDKAHVIATTIHRLPYFEIHNDGLLFEYKWDYIIFDESSMIGLHYITFAIMSLSKANPNAKFIVAGDPKQIPPVMEIDEKELENFEFQDENIYKIMNLESFDPQKQKIREKDTIQNLDTQYRSIPEIGKIFSELSYSGLLKHDRPENGKAPITNGKAPKQLPERFKKLISSHVTFVDIPLNQDHSIYKVNKLFYSSYHIYAAIFVSEMIKYFDTVNSDEWTIGLIAPYRAQAVLLNKLVTSYGISENVKVYADTVHGFQGDECDIVFFVCNPNNYEYSNHQKALLSKEYIYNVAISRAKDYLVILHPYTAIQNNNFINQIKTSYQNNFGGAKTLNAKDLEKTLFNVENYIENNTYISGHDSINVFGLSEMKYFIKVDDTAIDIQLRDLKRPEEISNKLYKPDNNLKHQV